MFIDGIKLGEGSEIKNLTVQSGTIYPTEPSVGELFYNLNTSLLEVFDGTNWNGCPTDAPIDGFHYVRQDGSWEQLPKVDLGKNVDISIPIYAHDTVSTIGILYLTDISGITTRQEWFDYVNSQYSYFYFSVGATGYTTDPVPQTIWLMDTVGGNVLCTFSASGNSFALSQFTWADIGAQIFLMSFVYNGFQMGSFNVVSHVSSSINYQPSNQALTDISTLSTNLETGVLTLDGGALTLNTTGYQPLATSLSDIDTNVINLVDAVFSCTGGVLVADTELWNFSQAILTGDGVPIKTGGVWAMNSGVPLTSATMFTVTDLLGSNLSGTGTYDALEINLTETGVIAGTFRSVTVDVYGRITAGTNPITLAGYGITDAYTKTQVDNLLAGLDIRASVRAATTANITLSAPQTIDGVSVIAGNRVLVKDQTTASENGIYTVAAGAWTRAADANTAAELSSGTYCFVEEGTVNTDSGWILITDGTITLGTTALTFTQFNGLGQVTAGTGITKNGNTISLSSGVTTPGTYKSVTVDTYGRITVGTNPTTLAGYGITDAPVINPGSPKDGDIKIAAGPIISIYASAAWRQIWPAVYS